MNREKLNRVEGVIVAVVSTAGYFESVKAIKVVPESMTADVEGLFARWLSAPCKLPSLKSALPIEIPFIFRVD